MECARPEELAVAAGRPRALEDKGAPSACEMGLRGSNSHPLFAVPLSSGHTGPICREQRRNGRGCQRPSCGHGSGPTGNCLPEMPDCDQPRRAFPRILLRVSVRDARCSILVRRGCEHFRLQMQEQWVCAHAETRSALIQVFSQKKWRKLHCRLLDNVPESKQSQRTAQQRRGGEYAHAFAIAFRRKLRRPSSA